MPSEEGGAFCAACGTRLAAAPREVLAGPVPTQPGRSVPTVRLRRAIAVASLLAVVAVAATGFIGGPRPTASPGTAASGAPAGTPFGASASTSTSASAPGSVPPTVATGSRQAPTATPGPVAAGSPVGAVEAFYATRGQRFAGLCSAADPGVSAGAYCAAVYQDRGAVQVHLAGLVGSEPDTWLLVIEGQYGWGVIETAPVVTPFGGPPF